MPTRQSNQGTCAHPFHDDERQQALLDEARAGSCAGQEALLESQRRAMTLWFQHRLTGDLQAKLDADDLVQEDSWDAWEGFADFDGLSIAQFRAWLKTICRCRLAMVGRNQACGCRASHGEQALDEAVLGHGSQRPWRRSCMPDEECRAAELQRRYELLLAELPADERGEIGQRIPTGSSFIAAVARGLPLMARALLAVLFEKERDQVVEIRSVCALRFARKSQRRCSARRG